MIDDDSLDDIMKIFGLIVILVIGMSLILRLSMFLMPTPSENNTKFKDWSSKPYTGWSNLNPMKLATYREIEVQSGAVKPNKDNNFKGV